jgi:nitroimidazol reductase NimA-like FMN-containing flavoprotein (pyridoxamine 5'-phosphate oxidase superfamily)
MGMKDDFKPRHDNGRCEEFIEGTYQGVLVMCHENVPYAVPMNHGYAEGRFYFHCATHGRKLDMLRRNPNVCYVIRKYYGTTEDREKSLKCHGPWESVIAYGKARVIEEPGELYRAFRAFMGYHGRADYEPSDEAYTNTRAIIIDVEHMTARKEYEGNKTEYWIWER